MSGAVLGAGLFTIVDMDMCDEFVAAIDRSRNLPIPAHLAALPDVAGCRYRQEVIEVIESLTDRSDHMVRALLIDGSPDAQWLILAGLLGRLFARFRGADARIRDEGVTQLTLVVGEATHAPPPARYVGRLLVSRAWKRLRRSIAAERWATSRSSQRHVILVSDDRLGSLTTDGAEPEEVAVSNTAVAAFRRALRQSDRTVMAVEPITRISSDEPRSACDRKRWSRLRDEVTEVAARELIA